MNWWKQPKQPEEWWTHPVTKPENIVIGEGSAIAPTAVLDGNGGLTIGNGVRITAHTVVVPSNHIIDQPETPISQLSTTCEGITIEDPVWIGAGVRILADSIAGGVPAKVIRSRV